MLGTINTTVVDFLQNITNHEINKMWHTIIDRDLQALQELPQGKCRHVACDVHSSPVDGSKIKFAVINLN